MDRILLVAIALMGFAAPKKSVEILPVNTVNTDSLLYVQKREIEVLQRRVDSLYQFAQSRKLHRVKRSTDLDKLTITNSLISFEKGVVKKASKALGDALESWNGPVLRVTSVHRSSRPNSAHYHGLAVDFKADEEVLAYLLSEEGQLWLQKHNLEFFIEDRYKSRDYLSLYQDERFKPYCRIIPWASGLHVHLEVVRSK